MEEIWKPVPGYEDAYEVSNLGRVRSLDRMCLGKDGRYELHKGRVLKQETLWNGYLQVDLRTGGKRKHRTVHSLVAAAFIGPRPKGYDIAHADGNRANNTADNLTYETRASNLHGTYNYGGRQGPGKLSLAEVDDVRSRIERGESCYSIAKSYGLHPTAVYHIRDGRSFAWYEGGEADAGEPCASKPICI